MRLTGLVPAALTPFDSRGDLSLSIVDKQAERCLAEALGAVFVAGTTGEFSSLTIPERLALAERWLDAARGTKLCVVVHVGANALRDAQELARHAEKHGAAAIATVAPNYVKPKNTEQLAAWCGPLAAAAPATPFYFYDIPVMTGVQLSMPEFVQHAAAIPTFAGLKFTNADLMAFQQLRHAENGRLDVVWGYDEYLLAALVLGAEGAVGSTYNFAAPLYQRIIAALQSGNLSAARGEQFRSVQLIALMQQFGFQASAKEAMRWRGIDTGPARPPHANLTSEQANSFRKHLESIGI
ncbi:MAG TPA: dihydrodipicolinate synthase family protein [Gemmataceae bacterium]